MLAVMTSFDSGPDRVPGFPDEVPVADAVERILPVEGADEEEATGPDEPPLETNESDWQEQRVIVEDFDEDEFR